MTSAHTGGFARLEPRHVVLLAVAAALLAFLPSVVDGFVFDDDALITRNPFAHDLAYAGRCFTTDLWDTPARPVAESSVRFYRPVVCLSYVLNWKLGGGAPWSFHLVNVLIHALACALAARIALRWTGSRGLAALVAALVFAIHPTHTENVIWVSGRTDVFMAAMLFAALELAVAAARRTRAIALWLAAAASFACAVLAKEVAICWPLLLAVEAVLAKDEGAGSDARPTERRLATAAAASLLAVIAYVVVRGRTMPLRPDEIETMALPPVLHAGYVALSLGYYVERVFFPWPQTFHFRPLRIEGGEPVLFTPSVVLGAVAAALWVFWIVRALRRERALGLMAVVGALLTLPILNVSYTGFPGTTADRFLYLPLFFVAIAACRHAATAIDAWALRPISTLVTSAVSLLMCAVGWVRTLDYLSNETVWRHELEVNPNNPQALAGLSQLLASEGDLDDASLLLRRALSPDALAYRLLSSPARYYFGLLEMQGPRLADGNVPALEALLGELASLTNVKAPASSPTQAGDLSLVRPPDEHFSVHLGNAVEHLAAAGALVASRLGHDHGSDDLLHPFVARVGRGLDVSAEGHYNLALALGRAGDYAGARAELARAAALDASPPMQSARAGLETTLSKVERNREAAATRGEPEASLLRAAVYMDLGAYLRAARELRSAHAARPADADVTRAYIDALVHARLETDARAAAASLPGGEGVARIGAVRQQLSPRTASAQPLPAGGTW